MVIYLYSKMTYRKKIESLVQNDCMFWKNHISIELICSSCHSYVWEIVHEKNVYEITYSDNGDLSMISTKLNSPSEIRELHFGNNSIESYNKMINILCDNFTDMI